MTPLGFDPGVGRLYVTTTAAAIVRLLTRVRAASTKAEIVSARLRTLAGRRAYYHAGRGAFDGYEVTAAEVRGIEVKLRQTTPGREAAAWVNKANRIEAARLVGIELVPFIEQVVTDERGRRTWLLVPGIMPAGRVFVDGRGGRTTTRLDRFVHDRLNLVGGTVLVRDVPTAVHAAWDDRGPRPSRWTEQYARNLAEYDADPRRQAMAKQVKDAHVSRANFLSLDLVRERARLSKAVGNENELTRLFDDAADAQRLRDEAEALAECNRRLEAELADLRRQLGKA